MTQRATLNIQQISLGSQIIWIKLSLKVGFQSLNSSALHPIRTSHRLLKSLSI